MRYHLHLSEWLSSNKKPSNKCWRGCGEKGTLCIVGGIVNWCSHYWKTVWRLLKKLKIELPYEPAISLLGNLSENNQNINSKRYMHSNVYCSIIYNSQDTEATWVSINRQINKEDVISISIVEYYSAIKGGGDLAIFDMTGSRGHCAK